MRSIMAGIIIAISSIVSTTNTAIAANFDVQKEVNQNEAIYHVNMDKNERVQVGDSNLILILTKLEDFRCPVGLSCWWEGGIMLHMDVIKDGQVAETMLLYQDQPTQLRLFNRIITLANIASSSNETYQIVLKMTNVANVNMD